MFRVGVVCANLFHEENEGLDGVVATSTRTVENREELDELLARGVDVHARCYCGHVTPVTATTAVLLGEDE